MPDPKVSYFFRKYYNSSIIKWWYVSYDKQPKRVWPTRAEEAKALAQEAELARIEEEERLAREEAKRLQEEEEAMLSDESYNATTGSFSGRYGQGPMDADTAEALSKIMAVNSSQNSIDSMLVNAAIIPPEPKPVELPPEHDEVIREANAIYERLLREAAEDEAKKQAEIEAARLSQA